MHQVGDGVAASRTQLIRDERAEIAASSGLASTPSVGAAHSGRLAFGPIDLGVDRNPAQARDADSGAVASASSGRGLGDADEAHLLAL